MRLLNLFFYHFCSWSVAILLMLLFSLRVRGERHLPRRGGVLLVANHQSFLDPPAIGCARRRAFYYLGRKSLFKSAPFAWLLRQVHTVPVDQEGIGIEGIRNIMARLEAGHPVLIFPEGERTRDGQLQPFKAGIALLLKRVKVPVQPVAIAGAYAAWPRWQKWPTFSPLFLPANGRGIAVVYGQPREAAALAKMPREEMLALLQNDVKRLIERAEALRRK